MTRYVVPAVLLAAAIGALWWWRRPDPSGPRVEARQVKVERGDIRLVVSATGEVKPSRQVELKCKASGQVLKFRKVEGDPVEAGEVLAELDPRTEQRNVEREEAGLASAEARLALVRLEATKALAQGRSQVSGAAAEEKTRREDLERIEKLDRNVVTETDLANARLAVRLAEERRTQAEAELALATQRQEADASMADADVKRARVQVADARERRADTEIRSPIKGILLRKSVEEGMIVSSGLTASSGGTTVAIVADVTALVVETNVDETDVGKVRVGQPATVSVEAHPGRSVKGRVDHLPPRGDLDSSIIVFKVLVGIPGSEFGMLRIGMTASVTILAEERQGVLLLPSEAVRSEGRKRYVLKGETRAEVSTGIDDGTRIEVLTGVSEGETVTIPAPTGGAPGPGGGPRRMVPRF